MFSKNTFSLIIGVIVILFGVVLLFNNLGLTDIKVSDIIRNFWPLILIFIGIKDIFNEKETGLKKRNLVIPSILILFGFFILLRNLGLYDFDFSIIWKLLFPVLMIYVGLNIFRDSLKTDKTDWAFMSGIEYNNSWKLTSKSYVAFMGGIELDFTKADISDEEVNLYLTAIMGGISIKCSKDFNIVCNGSSVFAGVNFFSEEAGGVLNTKSFENKGKTDSPKIIINYRVIMGGIDIKSIDLQNGG